MRLDAGIALCLMMGVQAVHAHMQLVLPPAINSKSDPQTVEANMYVPLDCIVRIGKGEPRPALTRSYR